MFYILIFIVLIFIFVILLSKFFLKKKNKILPHAEVEYITKDYVLEKEFNPDLEDLAFYGQKMIKANVTDIFFVHGTFVGDDPFDIVSLLGNVLPKKFHFIESKLKSYLKKSQDFFARDLGNFTQEHLSLVFSMGQAKINPHLVFWSSGNHHMARVRGCLTLMLKLDSLEKKSKALLIGHSHGGQIFALLTRFMANPSELNEILTKLEFEKTEIENYLSIVKKLNKISLDIVTLGAPARYQWYSLDNMRLIHFINHRNNTIYGGDFSGAIFTKHGDYVQQWGVAGSDIKPPSKKEQKFNDILADHLGESGRLAELKDGLSKKNRLHNLGVHLLIDYGDDAYCPNFFRTILGHACYTRIRHFKLLLQLIVQKLY